MLRKLGKGRPREEGLTGRKERRQGWVLAQRRVQAVGAKVPQREGRGRGPARGIRQHREARRLARQ